MQNFINLAGVFLVLGMALNWWMTEQQVDAYNTWIASLRTSLAEQDRLSDTIAKAADQGLDDAELASYSVEWVKQAKAILAKVEAIEPDDDEVAQLHVHMKAQAQAFTAWVEALDRVAHGDQGAITLMDAKSTEREAAFVALTQARERFAQRHGVNFVD